jgi:histidinol phosphatase-like enzyme
MKVTKVVFLDVDGVLNNDKTERYPSNLEELFSPFVLDKENITQLKRILKETGAKIVLSSTWRMSEEGCRTLAKEASSYSRSELEILQTLASYIAPIVLESRKHSLAASERILDGIVGYYPFNGNPDDESGNPPQARTFDVGRDSRPGNC